MSYNTGNSKDLRKWGKHFGYPTCCIDYFCTEWVPLIQELEENEPDAEDIAWMNANLGECPKCGLVGHKPGDPECDPWEK